MSFHTNEAVHLVSFTTMRPCHSKSLPAGIDECNIRKQVSRGREAGSSIQFLSICFPCSPCSAMPSVFQLNLDRGSLDGVRTNSTGADKCLREVEEQETNKASVQ